MKLVYPIRRTKTIFITEDENDNISMKSPKFNQIFNTTFSCKVIYGILPRKFDIDLPTGNRIWECSVDYYVEIDPIYATSMGGIIKTLDLQGHDSSFLLARL
jgi:hypothetical protein